MLSTMFKVWICRLSFSYFSPRKNPRKIPIGNNRAIISKTINHLKNTEYSRSSSIAHASFPPAAPVSRVWPGGDLKKISPLGWLVLSPILPLRLGRHTFVRLGLKRFSSFLPRPKNTNVEYEYVMRLQVGAQSFAQGFRTCHAHLFQQSLAFYMPPQGNTASCCDRVWVLRTNCNIAPKQRRPNTPWVFTRAMLQYCTHAQKGAMLHTPGYSRQITRSHQSESSSFVTSLTITRSKPDPGPTNQRSAVSSRV